MLRTLLVIFLLMSTNMAQAEDNNRIWFNTSNPSLFTSREVIYEYNLGSIKENQNGFVGIGLSNRELDQGKAPSLHRQAATLYLGANATEGLMHRVGLGYEGGDGDKTGFIVNRFGYIARQDCSLACDFSFGVDWRVNFRETEIQNIPLPESEVSPYFGFAINF